MPKKPKKPRTQKMLRMLRMLRIDKISFRRKRRGIKAKETKIATARRETQLRIRKT